MKIGEKTLRKGGEILTNAMLAYVSKINEAWLNNGEDELKLGLSLVIKPGTAAGNFKLKADITFVTEKISDSFSDSVDELQLSLFDKNKDTKTCPRSRVDPETGLTVVESTAEMSTVRFNKYYIEFLDCYIPDPNECENYEDK